MKLSPSQRTISGLPWQTMLAGFQPESLNREDRTLEVRFYSGARVERWSPFTGEDILLEFSVDPDDVRLDRANGGAAPLLDDHRRWGGVRSALGIVDSAEVNGKEGIAVLRFSGREDVEPVLQDVADGVLRCVSMGARIHRLEEITEDDDDIPVFRATDWELMEISLVSMPADANAQTLGAEKINDCIVVLKDRKKEKNMDRKLARRLNDAIESLVSSDRTRESVVESLAQRADLALATLSLYLLGSDAEDQKRPGDIPEAALKGLATELKLEIADLRKDAEEDGLAVLKEPAPAPAPRPAADPDPTSDPAGGEVVRLADVEKMVRQAQADARREERERATAIRERAGLASLSGEFADSLVDSEMSVEEAVDAILTERARLDRQADTRGHIRIGEQESDKVRLAMETALLHRFKPAKYELGDCGAGDFRGMTLLELARWSAERAGKSTTGVGRMELAKLALHSTSDYPAILANVANRTLRDAYDEAPRTWQPIAREVSANDFKTIHRVQMGEAPNLEKVNEHGEFRRGSISEGEETYKVETYGKIIGITRQVIVNDDLNAFTRVPQLFGISSARLESDLIWGLIIANAAMADGNALFSAAHGNLAAAGGAISNTTLDAGMSAIGTQKGLDGEAHLNLMGRYLCVPIAKRATALKFVGDLAKQRVVATKSTDLPVFADELSVIAEPRLDEDSAVSWYLAADPDQIDGVEYAYLEGQRGVAIETRNGFDVDGVEVKARLDFGTGVVDHRGLYKNPGA